MNLYWPTPPQLRRHTAEIGEVYDDPVIAMDKITQAHQELIEAIDYADHLRQQGISKSQENIAKLAQLSKEFHDRAGAVNQTAGPLSIEA